MRFADKLRELRDAAGLSEAKLAKLSGVSFGAIHNYGLGNRMPTFPAVVKLARALGTTCEAFADCEDVAAAEAPASEPAAGAAPRRGRRRQAAEGEPEAAPKRPRKRKDG